MEVHTAFTVSLMLPRRAHPSLWQVPRVMFLAPLPALTLSLYEGFAKQLVSQRTGIPVAELQ